eukprot:TRINITY_DN34542_c0_g1_i1.p1 TRINITY_DN34542_c0_g1~~TRINITY_DN34542_c0_g1_i1.p1  ORF type:complete len:197 (-),score=15.25 TRINITY_DN34542_c0_g1_i1:422-967(-)
MGNATGKVHAHRAYWAFAAAGSVAVTMLVIRFVQSRDPSRRMLQQGASIEESVGESVLKESEVDSHHAEGAVLDPVSDLLPTLLSQLVSMIRELPQSITLHDLDVELQQLQKLDLRSAFRLEAERYEPLLQLSLELQDLTEEALHSTWSNVLTDERAQKLLQVLHQDDSHNFGSLTTGLAG